MFTAHTCTVARSGEKHKVWLLITVSYSLGQHCQDYIWQDVDEPYFFGTDTHRFILLRLCPDGGDGSFPTMSACVLRENVVIDKIWIISISWIACFSDAKRLCYHTMTLVCQRGGWWRESVPGGRGRPGSLWPFIADNLNRSPVGLEVGSQWSTERVCSSSASSGKRTAAGPS